MTKTRTFVHCRVCGKQHTNPHSSSICPNCGKVESERNEAERQKKPKEIEYVSVPKELLAKVLDQAWIDNRSVESEWNSSDQAHVEFAKERELIEKLRIIAGIEE